VLQKFFGRDAADRKAALEAKARIDEGALSFVATMCSSYRGSLYKRECGGRMTEGPRRSRPRPGSEPCGGARRRGCRPHMYTVVRWEHCTYYDNCLSHCCGAAAHRAPCTVPYCTILVGPHPTPGLE
jgi:hypothetical protein